MKIINVHAHIWEDQDVDERIAHYTCDGMVKICVIGRHKARIALQKYNKLVIGLGIVFPGEDPPDLVDWYADEGFSGAKFICPRAPYDSDAYLAYYGKLAERNMVAAFHTGYVSDLGRDTSILWMHPMTLDRIARNSRSSATTSATPGTSTHVRWRWPFPMSTGTSREAPCARRRCPTSSTFSHLGPWKTWGRGSSSISCSTRA